MGKQNVNMKQFLNELENNVEEGSAETLAWIAEQTDPIVEWRLLQTTEDSRGNISSFIVFTTASGVESTLPLLNDNVSNLIRTIITSTPDLDPEAVPYIPNKQNFWRKYKKQIIFFGVFVALFLAATIANIIVAAQNTGTA